MNQKYMSSGKDSLSTFLTHRYLEQVFNGILEQNPHEVASKIQEQLQLPPVASHVVTPRRLYTHHGLHIGKGRVIHYSGLARGFSSGPVEEVSLEDFCGGQKYWVKQHNHPRFTKEEIVARARSRLNETEYFLPSNNCEHFVNWCIDNFDVSHQVTNVGNIASLGIRYGAGNAGAMLRAVNSTQAAFRSYLKGDINKEKLIEETSHAAINMASVSYYGMLGQTAIGIPGVGFVVGAGIGLLIGNVIQNSGLIALGESAAVREARERREEVAALCRHLAQEYDKSKVELEKCIQKYFKGREDSFRAAFEDLEVSRSSLNTKQFTNALEAINNKFGDAMLSFGTFEDFEKFMASDSSFKF